MNRSIVLSALLLSLSLSACATEEITEEISVPASSGIILTTGHFAGDIFAFPSEQMDGVFCYSAYAAEDFGNHIYFYDFQTSRWEEVVSGWNDDGRGRLINDVTGKSLLGDMPEEDTTGRIAEVFLDRHGSLVFRTEIGTRHRISVDEDRGIHIAETKVTGGDARFRLTMPFSLSLDPDDIDDTESVANYKTVVNRESVGVEIVDGQVEVLKGAMRYRITGIAAEGIHVSKDSAQLGVFGKVAPIDLDWSDPGPYGIGWRSEEEKQLELQRIEREVKDQEALARIEQLLSTKNTNAVVIYYLGNF